MYLFVIKLILISVIENDFIEKYTSNKVEMEDKEEKEKIEIMIKKDNIEIKDRKEENRNSKNFKKHRLIKIGGKRDKKETITYLKFLKKMSQKNNRGNKEEVEEEKIGNNKEEIIDKFSKKIENIK